MKLIKKNTEVVCVFGDKKEHELIFNFKYINGRFGVVADSNNELYVFDLNNIRVANKKEIKTVLRA